ncbi:putative quinol monooxygenase [Rhizobium sp. AN80A]|uniref:putative quinol monooxygenase n=1 Tax=Rhizobium sp. AN80A TaxID=3040673 RepID=UPI0024B3609F|nr:putative quinol monooxygenase [Rhizobium sp. AN80A]
MLTLIAHLHAKPEKAAELEEVLHAFAAPTRQEAGCVDYHFHRSSDDRLHFMFYENWKDRKAFEEHLETPHLKGFWENRLSYLTKDADITFYDMESAHPSGVK